MLGFVLYDLYMKAIQITVDEELLRKIDATDEVKSEGRSAVFRRAAAEYLRRRRNEEVAAAYARAYRSSLGQEFEGWSEEAEWPSE